MKKYILVNGDVVETYENYERALDKAMFYVKNHPEESAYVVCLSCGFTGAHVFHQEITFVEDGSWLIQEKR